MRKTNIAKGILTPDQVREIRKRLANGEKRSAIAHDYDVGYWVIKEIHNGKNWAWLED